MHRRKMLIIGANHGVLDIIHYAQSCGIYTIVSDYVPYEKSEAKKAADSYWMISSRDVNELEAQARSVGIDAIVAGCSEAAIEVQIELCSRLGLPCYASWEAWNIATNKLLFKRKCIEHGILTPKEYRTNDSITYPVIVKPADACANKGISVCDNSSSLPQAIEYARNNSNSGTVLVEEYIEDGVEVAAAYIMEKGVAHLLYTYVMERNEKGGHGNNGLARTDFELEERFCKNMNDKVTTMLVKEGFINGPVFVQCIEKNGDFYAFEMAYRIVGNMSYYITDKMYFFNEIRFITDFALDGNAKIINYKKKSNNVFATYILWSKSGVITSIYGEENIRSLDGVDDIIFFRRIGETMTYDGTMRQLVGIIFLNATNSIELRKLVSNINEKFDICDANGKSIIYKVMY